MVRVLFFVYIGSGLSFCYGIYSLTLSWRVARPGVPAFSSFSALPPPSAPLAAAAVATVAPAPVRSASSSFANRGNAAGGTGSGAPHHTTRGSWFDQPATAAAASSTVQLVTAKHRAKFKDWQFVVLMLLELASASTPLTRLATPTHEEADGATAGEVTTAAKLLLATVVMSALRGAFWLCIVYRIGKYDRVFVIDTLAVRVLVVECGYTVLTLWGTGFSAWVALSTPVDLVMLWMYTAYFRSMIAYYDWDATTITVYKFVKFYAPAVYMIIGVVIIEFPVYEHHPTALLLYLSTCVNYTTNMFTIVCTVVPDPRTSSPIETIEGGVVVVDVRKGDEEKTGLAAGEEQPKRKSVSEQIQEKALKFSRAFTRGATDLLKRAGSMLPVEQINKSPSLKKTQFVVAVAIELLSSTTPIFRLSFLPNAVQTRDQASRATLTTCFFDAARVLIWIFFVYLIRNREEGWFDEVKKFDGITARAVLFTMSYAAMLQYNAPYGFSVANIFAEFAMNVVLSAYIRSMCAYYHWTVRTLQFYKAQRLYASLFWMACGVWIMYQMHDGLSRTYLMLYIGAGVGFLSSIYDTTTGVRVIVYDDEPTVPGRPRGKSNVMDDPIAEKETDALMDDDDSSGGGGGGRSAVASQEVVAFSAPLRSDETAAAAAAAATAAKGTRSKRNSASGLDDEAKRKLRHKYRPPEEAVDHVFQESHHAGE